ncbi:Uncharacterised protein [Yersinia frederiksenii]|uniref:hypothetical protein n=1 Tax=Yersinia frederiksenii TaxID=29484 RepID=UPI0005E8AFA6|nr:hypothetical protein [Yersinia frederiksenii]CND06689.1 Uncharacterised protein [Yersinia frederiksenii]
MMDYKKLSEQSDEIQITIINAARDITVAKIQVKGAKFDQYTQPFNWFGHSMNEIMRSLREQERG